MIDFKFIFCKFSMESMSIYIIGRAGIVNQFICVHWTLDRHLCT